MQLSRLLLRFMHRVWRLSRGQTLRVCVLMSDPDGGVFLLPHGTESDSVAWFLPSAPVLAGESSRQTAERALEAAGLQGAADPLTLHGLYKGGASEEASHVILYRCAGAAAPLPAGAAGRFFAADALPPRLDPAARQRIAEIRAGAPPAAVW